VVRTALQELLEAEMTASVGAAKCERTVNRVDIAPARKPALWPALPDPWDQRHQQETGGEPGAICLPPAAQAFPYLIVDARYEKFPRRG
jgi:hypothetical protein